MREMRDLRVTVHPGPVLCIGLALALSLAPCGVPSVEAEDPSGPTVYSLIGEGVHLLQERKSEDAAARFEEAFRLSGERSAEALSWADRLGDVHQPNPGFDGEARGAPGEKAVRGGRPKRAPRLGLSYSYSPARAWRLDFRGYFSGVSIDSTVRSTSRSGQ